MMGDSVSVTCSSDGKYLITCVDWNEDGMETVQCTEVQPDGAHVIPVAVLNEIQPSVIQRWNGR